MAHFRLGDLLVNIGLITSEQLGQALAGQKGTGKRLGRMLIEMGFVTEHQVIEALQMQLGIDFVDLSAVQIPAEMSQILSKNIAKKHSVLPLRLVKDTLYLAMSDPTNFVALEDVKRATRKKVVPVIATEAAVERAIMTLYGSASAAKAIEEMKLEVSADGIEAAPATFNTTVLDGDSMSAPTVKLVNSILERAIVERASDIHLEPREDALCVRMRIDGVLMNALTVPKDLQNAVISRLKIMGSMDISEKRIPQDGRANIKVHQADFDLRMSTLPTIYGEKLVVRMLDKNSGLLNKEAIGLIGEDLQKYNMLVANHSGVILIVGPTGSGKSSTMYSMIRELNAEQINLVTLEDPVEYNIDGINQVQINEKIEMTMAGGLRSILRQDPDIIAVGEIRDSETAQIAMQAAITGHLVLSTLHTNSALAAIDRLKDIGCEPYLIASSLRGVLSQRLVRRICPQCRQEYTPADEELEALGLRPDAGRRFYRGAGCPSCFNTGFRGRVGVFEILLVDTALRRAIYDGLDPERLREIALRSGRFVPFADNCRRLVLEGVTTTAEAFKAINSADL